MHINEGVLADAPLFSYTEDSGHNKDSLAFRGRDDHCDMPFSVKLYENKQKLLIYENKVLWLIGELLFRKINVDEPIVSCFFTSFDRNTYRASTDSTTGTPKKVLVIVLEDQIRVYDREKSVSIVSFPMHIKSAFPFYKGIVIGKKSEGNSSIDMSSMNSSFTEISLPMDPIRSIQESPYPANSPFVLNSANFFNSTAASSSALSDSNFLALTDPVGELGYIVSSSTTSFSLKEQMVSFPLTSDFTLSATYNPDENVILIYHVRYLSRSKNTKSKIHSNSHSFARKSNKRSASSGTTMNTSRIFDDDRHIRTSSNPLSYDRMASGVEYLPDTMGSSSGLYSTSSDNWNLRKEMIFTKIKSVPFNNDISSLRIFNSSYEDKEAIVIVDLKSQQIDIDVYEKSKNQVGLPRFKETISLNGLDAKNFGKSPGEFSYIAILKAPNQLVLYNPFYKLISPSILISDNCSPAVRIDDICDYEISLLCENGLHHTIRLEAKINNQYVKTFVESLRYLSHDLIYEKFWLQWCANISLNIPNCDDWKLYVITLLATCLPEKIDLSQVDIEKNEITEVIPFVELSRKINNVSISSKDSCLELSQESLSLITLLPKIVLALHSIREDLRLNILAVVQLHKLSLLLCQLVYWMSWSKPWQSYYQIDQKYIDTNICFEIDEYFGKPPNILESLGSLFSSAIVKYVTFSVIAGEDDIIDSIITPRTYYILRLFEVIISSEYEFLDLIRNMVSYGIEISDLETYPPGIYFIFRNIIELCQKRLKSSWNISKEGLKLIGRNDLLHLDVNESKKRQHLTDKSLSVKPMKQLLAELAQREPVSTWDGSSEADKFLVTKLIFSKDRRFYELTKLLQTSKIQTLTFESVSGLDDYEKLVKQRRLCAIIALRTLTTPIGRGAVFNSSKKPLVTEGFPIPKMNFTTLILPDNINVNLENDAIPVYLFEWGYFHNGASAGLSVSKNFDDISGSWVVFNKPPTLNSQHAGFLLGLGLNGHLRKLEEWHIYNYLGPKHVYTSIGLLIGMSASLKGTMDTKMTKVLSVHVVAFLPAGSTNLNVQLPVQIAGIIGVGLVYLETRHSRMSEILLSEISSTLTINDKQVVSECYQLSAGISLGYINLGKGEQILSSNDSHIIDRLVFLGTSIRDIQTLKSVEKSGTGSIIALMFMFLKTNNEEVAMKLSLPQTTPLLEYIRPDLLLLRCFAKNMILWNAIEPTKTFVESQIPVCISRKFSIESMEHLESNAEQYLNILTGALLSISICYASTGNIQAKSTLLYYFDILLDLGAIEPDSYDSRVALVTVRNSRDVVILGLSIIMAGTGDLDIMRRLRFLQGITDKYTRYGNYMAINIALGFLFLGGGQQAFNTRDNFSVAALITSVYPMFGSINYESLGGSEYSDGNDLHLQALRHFWALSVEDRCLVVREVDNEKPIKVDVDVTLKNKTSFKVSSPCLLPDLSLIQKIQINPDTIYFPVEFDFFKSSAVVTDKFKKRLSLYVEKRANYKKMKLEFMDMVDISEKMSDHFDDDKKIGVNALKNLKIFDNLKSYERDILFDSIRSDTNSHLMTSTVFDFKYEIEKLVAEESISDDDKLSNLQLIFKYVDSIILLNEDREIVRKQKTRTKKFLGVDAGSNLANELEFDSDQEWTDNGLNYLNIEFMEELKKKLFFKLNRYATM